MMDDSGLIKLVEAGILLIVAKAFIEPVAVAAGQAFYRALDDMLHGKLPNFLRGDDK